MLTEPQLKVLIQSFGPTARSQRDIAASASMSLGLVNNTIRDLKDAGLLNSHGIATNIAHTAMKPYRVKKAVILAAGIGSRIAPLSFDRPKALFRVRGEVLIERLIRQLQDCGIDDITVVVGYMRESLFYLKDRFGVRLITNYDFATCGNYSSLLKAKEFAANAYICSSDQYFEENPFQSYVYKSTCTLIPASNIAGEYALTVNRKGNVRHSKATDLDAMLMQGPIYLDETDARRVIETIEQSCHRPNVTERFWEQFLLDDLRSYNLSAHIMPENSIHEFNYLRDLTAFDRNFIENVDLDILDNICDLFDCERASISDIQPLKEGLTNLSFLFSVNEDRYVYRHPGNGTDAIINRKAEEYALRVANRIGLDGTFVYEDPEQGWKVSKYVPNCTPFDYNNEEHVKKALSIVRRLHKSGETSPWSCDPYQEAQKIVNMLRENGYHLPSDFPEISRRIEKIASLLKAEPSEPVLCHNDFYGPNLLIHPDGEMDLIDWEYSAMGDYGNDIGNFVAQGSGFDIEQSTDALKYYFNRDPTPDEVRHCMSCIAIVGFYWYVWAMYKETQGAPVGEWLDVWYEAAKKFGKHAIGLYETGAEHAVGQLSKAEFNQLVAKFDNGTATHQDLAKLEPYRAKRAVLLASGFGSRLLPITATTPKPLVAVHGKRIICSILDALVAAGIEDIVIVRGYLAEKFDVLLEEYPQIHFVDNPIFDVTNNISSALAAAKANKHSFENAYVFESDLFLKNQDIIKRYQYHSNYLGVPVANTPDWCFDVKHGRIMDLHKGGSDVHHMYGVAYWTAEEGARLAKDLEAAFADEANRQRFWDDVPCVLYHDNYNVYIRECTFDDIAEVDSFDELCQIDPSYSPTEA